MVKAEKTKLQDIGLVNYQFEGQSQKRYFANVAGLAYDAYVVRYAAERPGIVSNKILYLFLLFRCLFQYTLTKAKVFFDGNEDENYYYSINCRQQFIFPQENISTKSDYVWVEIPVA